jgi:hypothetical protein
LLSRKKSALSLDSRYVTMVENAYYLVSPPDSPLEARKERPPLHQYIRWAHYTVYRYLIGTYSVKAWLRQCCETEA